MKKEIGKLIPAAIEATRKYLLKDEIKEIVQKEYNGYAASLGAALRTSGLIPSLTFYTDISRKDGVARRYKLLWAIAYCLEDEPDESNKRYLLQKVINDVYGEDVFNRELERNDQLLPLRRANNAAVRDWTKKITNASIALKLAMRNFEPSKT